MGLPPALRAALEGALRDRVVRAEPVFGGMICRAATVYLDSGPLFVKWMQSAPSDFFEAEADGLERLAATGTLRVPVVKATASESEEGAPSFLVLEYVPSREPEHPVLFTHRFGETLAALHQHPVPTGFRFGLDRDNYIGRLPQINEARDTWPQFYRDCRILPQMQIARDLSRMPIYREHLLMTVCERIEDILSDVPNDPCLVHGDLWSGNFLAAGDVPVVIDPAAHYGHREVEIAFIELFGGFPAGFLDAYRASFPLESGYERRRPLLQLYPLLVHLNHFGESYGPDVDAVCKAYV